MIQHTKKILINVLKLAFEFLVFALFLFVLSHLIINHEYKQELQDVLNMERAKELVKSSITECAEAAIYFYDAQNNSLIQQEDGSDVTIEPYGCGILVNGNITPYQMGKFREYTGETYTRDQIIRIELVPNEDENKPDDYQIELYWQDVGEMKNRFSDAM